MKMHQLPLFGAEIALPVRRVSMAPSTCTSLQARVAREGGGPASSRMQGAAPGYPIEHYYQAVPGLMVSVLFPHKLPHWPEGERVLTRISRSQTDGTLAFTIGGYEYRLSDLPAVPLAYPKGLGFRPGGWALLVAGDLVRVQPDSGKPFEGTLLDTLWMRPDRDELKLRVCTWPDISRFVVKRVAIGNIYRMPGVLENFADEHVMAQTWLARQVGKEVASV